jgi:hypothetical protein
MRLTRAIARTTANFFIFSPSDRWYVLLEGESRPHRRDNLAGRLGPDDK